MYSISDARKPCAPPQAKAKWFPRRGFPTYEYFWYDFKISQLFESLHANLPSENSFFPLKSFIKVADIIKLCLLEALKRFGKTQ